MRTLTLVCMAALVGCDGGEVSFEDLPSELSATACAAYQSCGSAYALSGPMASDQCDEYVESVLRNIAFPPYRTAIESGTIVYDAAAAADCLAAYEGLDCEIVGGTALGWAHIARCSRIFVGQVAVGGACELDEECDEGSFCGGLGCPGTCEPRTPPGGTCTEPSECQLGYLCTDGTCRERVVSSGEGTCTGSATLECGFGNACVGATSETPGQCTPYSELMTRAAGESCDLTASQLCQTGLSCVLIDAGVYECRAQAASGGPCFQGAPSMCPADHQCMPGVSAFEGTCVPLPREGESCTLGALPCGLGLTCSSGTCRAMANIGEACADNSGCFSNRCESGVCVGPQICPT